MPIVELSRRRSPEAAASEAATFEEAEVGLLVAPTSVPLRGSSMPRASVTPPQSSVRE